MLLLKNILKGLFELFIFMPAFVDNFPSDKLSAIKSLIFQVVLYVPVAALFYANQENPTVALLSLHALLSWGTLFAFYGVIYAIAASMHRKEYFYQTVTILNSMAFFSLILMIPLFIQVFGMKGTIVPENHYWIFFVLVNMAYTAFIVAKGLRLNLPLGAFLATVNLFLSDAGFQLIRLLVPESQI